MIAAIEPFVKQDRIAIHVGVVTRPSIVATTTAGTPRNSFFDTTTLN